MQRPSHPRRVHTASIVTRTAVSGILLAACSSVVAPAVSCVAIVNVDGALYGAADIPGPAAAEVSSVPYVTVTRHTGCLDLGQPGCELEHGESNFLPEGTPVHTVEGFPASQRLAIWSSTSGEWRLLTTMPDH